jgi:drug/metabolite transporter (DMT)-like permease
MITGILFALAACFIWGFIFVVPLFMEGFNAMEVVLGRYLFYGIVSCALFLRLKKKYPLEVWKKSFLYSLIFAVGYYPGVVLGLQYATPAICALIMGTGPITIAFYGNWKEKEGAFKTLLLPSILIAIGLVVINIPAMSTAQTPSTYLLGLAACFCALATWTWYVVANARFLKDHKQVSSSDWATLNGVTTLFMTLGVILIAFIPSDVALDRYMNWNYLLGSATLGMICSWVGIFLWNRTTLHLPISFAGQLTIFENIFGLFFIYLVQRQWPSMMEILGMALFFIAVLYGIRASNRVFEPRTEL